MTDLSDAKQFAEELIRDCDRATFYGFKHSAPLQRYYNLAKAFLEVSSPICCHASTQCEDCPMKHWEIPANSWLNPMSKQKPNAITKKNVVGAGGIEVVLNGTRYESINAAARALGVHKSVVNRMLRDQNV